MEASDALEDLIERVTCLRNPPHSQRGLFPSEVFSESKSRFDIEKETHANKACTLSNPFYIAEQLRTTEEYVHAHLEQPETTSAVETHTSKLGNGGIQQQQVPSLHELKELMVEFFQLYEEDTERMLTSVEKEYANEILQIAISSLAHMVVQRVQHQTLTSNQGNNNPADDNVASILGEVQVFLLEMAVRNSCVARQTTFTILHQISFLISSQLMLTKSRGLKMSASVHTHIKMTQNALFSLLLEILERILMVSSTNDSSARFSLLWIDVAVSCLLHFTKGNGKYKAERLMQIKPEIILFLLKIGRSNGILSFQERNSSFSTASYYEMEETLLEILVMAMYTQHLGIPASQTRQGSEVYLEEMNSTKTSFVHTTTKKMKVGQFAEDIYFPVIQDKKKNKKIVEFGLTSQIIEQFGGLEFFLFHFYTSPFLSTKELFFMVFFDLFYEERKRKAVTMGEKIDFLVYQQLYKCCCTLDLATLLTSTPFFLSATTLSSLAAQIATQLEPSLDEKQLLVLLQEFRILIQVEEVYGKSISLCNAIKLAKAQEQNTGGEMLLARLNQLFTSPKIEEVFKGERWLAELLSHGVETTKSNNTNSSALESDNSIQSCTTEENNLETAANGEDELEETFCFDESAEIRMIARSKFWELAKSSSPLLRHSFVRTLQLFLRRKLRPNMAGIYPNHIRELNTCIGVLLEQKETNPCVIVSFIMIIIQLCLRNSSYLEIEKRKYDNVQSNNPVWMTDLLYETATPIRRILTGEVSLDQELLQEINPEFFLHAMSVLHSCSHPRKTCRSFCCGNIPSLLGDTLACTAFIVEHIVEEQHTFSKIGGLTRFIPFIDSCDTRVGYFTARLMVNKLRGANLPQYYEILREMQLHATDEDDEIQLQNTYVHARTLLLKYFPRILATAT